MQITTRPSHSYPAIAQARTSQAAPQQESATTDSFTFGPTFGGGYNGPKEILLAGGMGLLPGVGALTNFAGMIGAGVANKHGLSGMGLAASAANLIGTGTAITGLLIGNSTATYAGLGMLAASGVSAAVIASAL